METYHISVLPQEVLSYIRLKPHGVYVDATFGGGGHTRLLLEAEPTITVLAFDWDMVALERNGDPLVAQYPDRLKLVWANFAQLQEKLKKAGYPAVDGILADFGTSQNQLMHRTGFSFRENSYLDMRMSSAHQKITAAQVIAYAKEQELVTIFKEYGQEPQARAIAHTIVEQRKRKPITMTNQLVEIIESVTGKRMHKKVHAATQVFQALRIYVNRELDNIHAFLPAALRSLKPGGRLVCISFHSLEDRIVKQFYRDAQRTTGIPCTVVTPKVVVASEQELIDNPSARSARLRVLERQ